MADLVDRAYLELDGETIDCDSIDWEINGNKNPRKAMNKKNRPIGHAHGVPDIKVSCSFAMDLDLQTKFIKIQNNNDRFTVVVECESQSGSSETYSFLDCEIYSTKTSAKDGEVTIDLEIGALDYVIT